MCVAHLSHLQFYKRLLCRFVYLTSLSLSNFRFYKEVCYLNNSVSMFFTVGHMTNLHPVSYYIGSPNAPKIV